jgi:pyroglutamyl-peptidase
MGRPLFNRGCGGWEMKALVTGFDAFGGDKINPSSMAVGRLKRRMPGLVIHAAILPTSYARSAISLRGAIHEVQPDIVLCVGQAGGRTELSLERVAINVQDARIRDNDGKQPVDRPVVRGGPAAHFATLPIKACVAEMRRAGLPASVSNSAGTFVCNHVFYALMDMAERHGLSFRGGFLHIPNLPEQAVRLGGGPSMSLDDIVRGIEITLAVSAVRTADVHTAEGALS